MEVGKTFQELQKTLSFIMGKMVNRSRVVSDGFAADHQIPQFSRASVMPTSTPASDVMPTCIADIVPSTNSVPSVASFLSCNSTAATASTPNLNCCQSYDKSCFTYQCRYVTFQLHFY